MTLGMALVEFQDCGMRKSGWNTMDAVCDLRDDQKYMGDGPQSSSPDDGLWSSIELLRSGTWYVYAP